MTGQSVREQTPGLYEWIIIDGASTDGTPDDFPHYEGATIISELDGGIYDAMNKGLGRAQGTYVIFMNAGDQFANAATLGDIAARIKDSTPDLIYGDSWEQETSGARFYKSSRPSNHILRGMFTHHQAMLYNRRALGQMRYDTHYMIAADYELTLRFLSAEKRQCLYLPVPLCIFESGGVSQRCIQEGRNEQFRARRAAHIPAPLNVWITLRQMAASLIRRHIPPLYRYIKRK